jgi:hypothetical protein
MQQTEQEYGVTAQNDRGNGGQYMTLQKAANYLKNTEPGYPGEVYEKNKPRRLADAETLDQLLDKLMPIETNCRQCR